MKVKILADSTADLSEELLKKYNITLIPLIINLGNEAYLDGETITTEDIYNYVKKTGELPKTSSINSETYTDIFRRYVEQGYEIVHLSLSSNMSVTHNNAVISSEDFKNVYVVDSLSLSTGIGIQAIYASELVEKGFSAKEIAEKLNNRSAFAQASFVLDNLTYLHKGGRCSSIALLGANLLNIKPCIEVKNGTMGVGKKYMGKFKKIVPLYVKDILEKYNNPDYTRVFVTHTEVAEDIVEDVKNILRKTTKFKEIIETTAGSTITSHCGKNTIGILYYNDGNENHY